MGFKGLRAALRIGRRQTAPRLRTSTSADRRRRKGHIDLSLAIDRHQIEGAYALVQAQYLRSGYAKPGGAVRFVSHCCVPTTHTLIASVKGTVVGTASLILDGPLGLPLETTYPAETQVLRQAGERLAEISCLATRRRGDAKVLLGLYRGIYALCRYRFAVDRLCITVHPRQGRFYQKALLFDVIGPVRDYAACNHAPAIALGLDLGGAETRFRRAHGWGWLARFFLGRGNLSGLAHSFQVGNETAARLAFAKSQPNWETLDRALRDQIVRCYAES